MHTRACKGAWWREDAVATLQTTTLIAVKYAVSEKREN